MLLLGNTIFFLLKKCSIAAHVKIWQVKVLTYSDQQNPRGVGFSVGRVKLIYNREEIPYKAGVLIIIKNISDCCFNNT